MEFTEVPQTPEGVLEFANNYGLIEGHFGPACAFWYPHIDAVAHLVAAWRRKAGKTFIEAWNALPLGICATRLVYRGRGVPPALAMVPPSLLSAIHLQLGQTVANATDVTQCRVRCLDRPRHRHRAPADGALLFGPLPEERLSPGKGVISGGAPCPAIFGSPRQSTFRSLGLGNQPPALARRPYTSGHPE